MSDTPKKKYDLFAAEKAMEDFLVALGQDMTDPNIKDTPRRVSKMFAEEILSGNLDSVTTFETKVGDQFLVVANLVVESTCSHHLLPFRGVAHVGVFFIADENGYVKLPGLSKYARIVEAYSRQLQLQERLTTQIADRIYAEFKPDFTYVVVDAEHYCMKVRGVGIEHSETVTSALVLSDRFKAGTYDSDAFIAQFYNKLSIRILK